MTGLHLPEEVSYKDAFTSKNFAEFLNILQVHLYLYKLFLVLAGFVVVVHVLVVDLVAVVLALQPCKRFVGLQIGCHCQQIINTINQYTRHVEYARQYFKFTLNKLQI